MCECVCVYIYIVIHRLTVSLYHNSSVWLDTWDAPSRDGNPPNFTSGWWHTHATQRLYAYASHFVFSTFLRSSQFVKTLHNAISISYISSPECSTSRPLLETYIVNYRQTVSLYHNSSLWLDTWNSSNAIPPPKDKFLNRVKLVLIQSFLLQDRLPNQILRAQSALLFTIQFMEELMNSRGGKRKQPRQGFEPVSQIPFTRTITVMLNTLT